MYRYDDKTTITTPAEAASAAAALAPTGCPVCGSRTITTMAKPANAESYWRCEGCGEVWHPGRRQSARGSFR